MRKTLLTFILSLAVTFIIAQKNTSLLFTYSQVNNHYRFHEIFQVDADPDEIFVFPKTDYIGIGIRHRDAQGHLFAFSASGGYRKGTSLKINVPYEEQQMPSYDIYSGGIFLRLEYGKIWSIPKHKPLRIGFMTSLNPRWSFNNYLSRAWDKFPSFFTTYETSLTIGPQFSYSVDNKFLVNFKLPIDVLNYHFVDGRQENPNVSTSVLNVTHSNIYALLLSPTFSLSVGYFIFHEDRK